jgi:hypothetical protein
MAMLAASLPGMVLSWHSVSFKMGISFSFSVDVSTRFSDGAFMKAPWIFLIV